MLFRQNVDQKKVLQLSMKRTLPSTIDKCSCQDTDCNRRPPGCRHAHAQVPDEQRRNGLLLASYLGRRSTRPAVSRDVGLPLVMFAGQPIC